MRLKPLLLLLCCCMTTATATAQDSPVPKDGATCYICNVRQKTYLKSDGERLTLANNGTPVELRDIGNGLYELLTPQGSMSCSVHSVVKCDGTGDYNQWAIKPVDGLQATYRLACRTKETNAFSFLHYDCATGLPGITPLTGGAEYSEAQWTLVSPSDYEQNMITLDENATQYTMPQGTTYTVRLKRNITLNSWCTFCVPFDIDGEQLRKVFGNDVTAAAYNDADGTRMNFISVKEIKKGIPYLLKKTTPAPVTGYYEFTVENGFCDQPMDIKPEGSDMGFHGTFIKTTAPSGAYAMSRNVMYHLVTDQELKGFRAYFFSDSPGGKEMTWTLDGTTAIENIDGNRCNTSLKTYNNAGQRTDRNNPRGVVITKGNKTIRK
ncbi:MAG: hypothetical protein NC344_11200 [Bacteroidales bacterium]|nr:hypothetical protein [Bacteroidales bacterium]MCM1148372.1 hypothetical protein [Bacteroidales bacterium]MCM1207045.1 hypothetical protein [Bacillota bacterium]MCM1511316.1 hypothetical protein [Clostridium sp.]